MRRSWLLGAALLLLAQFLIACGMATGARVEPSLEQPVFGPTGLDGGGFQNVIAIDPSGSGVVLAGGDVSGFHRSTDWGETWTTANRGVSSKDYLKVATILFSRTVPGRVYAGVGLRGLGGGLLVSNNAGSSWSLLSSVPRFSGSANVGVSGLPPEHPRSTGNLLAIDEAGGLMYAATFNQGLMRSSDEGRSWQVLGLEGLHLRSLALDEADPDVLYVGTYGAGIWKTSSARSEGTLERLGASPTHAEELVILGQAVFAAAGTAGLSRSLDGGETWEQLGAGTLPADGRSWTSIAGYMSCGGVTLYAGSDRGGPFSIAASVDGGVTWTTATGDPSRIHLQVAGTTDDWWLGSRSPAMLTGAGYTAAQIATDPRTPSEGCIRQRVWIAGRGGIWGSRDAASNWQPFVRGLAATIVRTVATDPNQAGRVIVGVTDWVSVYSNDGGSHVIHRRPPGGSVTFDIALDSSRIPSAVYLATGNRDRNAEGEVFSIADPSSGPWIDEGLSSVTGGKRPLAVTVRRSGGIRIIVAAVEGSGVWRKVGSVWSKASGLAMTTNQPVKAASFAWAPQSTTIYLYDLKSGVWRSVDSGKTWTKIWAKPSQYEWTGFVAVDPTLPTRLYVSVGNEGVYRIEGAARGTVALGTLVPIRLGGLQRPGAIGVDPAGHVFATEMGASAVDPQIYRSTDLGSTWIPLTDDIYRAIGSPPSDLSVASWGDLYVAFAGNGLLRG